MEQEYLSSQQLSEFVHQHDLMNSHSVVQFYSLVSIKTARRKIANKEMRVMITFDGYDNYGQLSLLDVDLDPNLFPSIFEAKWQNMKHINGEYLHIHGTHTKNPEIGLYEVRIIPLKRFDAW